LRPYDFHFRRTTIKLFGIFRFELYMDFDAFFYIYYPFLLNMLRIDKEFEGMSLTFVLNGDITIAKDQNSKNKLLEIRYLGHAQTLGLGLDHIVNNWATLK